MLIFRKVILVINIYHSKRRIRTVLHSTVSPSISRALHTSPLNTFYRTVDGEGRKNFFMLLIFEIVILVMRRLPLR